MMSAMPVPRTPPKMFETRSQSWQEVGLLRQINPRVVKRARLEALVLVPLFVAVVLIYDNRVSLFGKTVPATHGATASRSPRTGCWKNRWKQPCASRR